MAGNVRLCLVALLIIGMTASAFGDGLVYLDSWSFLGNGVVSGSYQTSRADMYQPDSLELCPSAANATGTDLLVLYPGDTLTIPVVTCDTFVRVIASVNCGLPAGDCIPEAGSKGSSSDSSTPISAPATPVVAPIAHPSPSTAPHHREPSPARPATPPAPSSSSVPASGAQPSTEGSNDDNTDDDESSSEEEDGDDEPNVAVSSLKKVAPLAATHNAADVEEEDGVALLVNGKIRLADIMQECNILTLTWGSQSTKIDVSGNGWVDTLWTIMAQARGAQEPLRVAHQGSCVCAPIALRTLFVHQCAYNYTVQCGRSYMLPGATQECYGAAYDATGAQVQLYASNFTFNLTGPATNTTSVDVNKLMLGEESENANLKLGVSLTYPTGNSAIPHDKLNVNLVNHEGKISASTIVTLYGGETACNTQLATGSMCTSGASPNATNFCTCRGTGQTCATNGVCNRVLTCADFASGAVSAAGGSFQLPSGCTGVELTFTVPAGASVSFGAPVNCVGSDCTVMVKSLTASDASVSLDGDVQVQNALFSGSTVITLPEGGATATFVSLTVGGDFKVGTSSSSTAHRRAGFAQAVSSQMVVTQQFAVADYSSAAFSSAFVVAKTALVTLGSHSGIVGGTSILGTVVLGVASAWNFTKGPVDMHAQCSAPATGAYFNVQGSTVLTASGGTTNRVFNCPIRAYDSSVLDGCGVLSNKVSLYTSSTLRMSATCPSEVTTDLTTGQRLFNGAVSMDLNTDVVLMNVSVDQSALMPFNTAFTYAGTLNIVVQNFQSDVQPGATIALLKIPTAQSVAVKLPNGYTGTVNVAGGIISVTLDVSAPHGPSSAPQPVGSPTHAAPDESSDDNDGALIGGLVGGLGGGLVVILILVIVFVCVKKRRAQTVYPTQIGEEMPLSSDLHNPNRKRLESPGNTPKQIDPETPPIPQPAFREDEKSLLQQPAPPTDAEVGFGTKGDENV